MDRLDDSERLLSLLPPIRRARLWRLYAQDGRRFLDFWMDGGRDILGAKGTGLGTALKAAVDLGTARPLPSVWKARLAKQVAELWPGYAALRLYLNEERALAALGREMGTRAAQDSAAADSAAADSAAADSAAADSAAADSAAADSGAADSAAPVAVGDPNGGGLVFDPAERPAPRSPGTVLLLRPYAEALGAPGTGSRPGPEDAPEPRFAPRFAAALVRLPCPRVFSPAIALLRDGEAAARMSEDLVPPLVLAAASRSLWEFKRFAESYDEKLWRRVDRRLGPFFERSGPYLYPRHSAAEHEARFRAALEAGALISPIHALPSIVPGDFDDGELARLAAALAR